METKLLNKLVKFAVKIFLENDKELLNIGDGVHEQAISHRIAVYLEHELNKEGLEGYNVDCEYNRNGEEPKALRSIIDEFSEVTSEFRKRNIKFNEYLDQVKSFLVRPDIVVHERGSHEHNLIVIEIKKNNSSREDEKKLCEFTYNYGDYQYQLGVHIWFEDEEPQYKWFQNGQEIDE
jgi:hypothetical protein